jgi:hypothetical protein
MNCWTDAPNTCQFARGKPLNWQRLTKKIPPCDIGNINIIFTSENNLTAATLFGGNR